jgi:cystathionine beta-lyase
MPPPSLRCTVGAVTDPLSSLSLADLRRRTSQKWRAYPVDVLPLWVAEMDVELADPVVRAVMDAIRLGDTGYPMRSGYAEAFAAFAASRWSWEPDPARMRIMTDVMLGIAEAIRTVTEAGAGVVINPPVYPPFVSFTEMTGRGVIGVPLGEDLRLDLAALERAFAGGADDGVRPGAYLLCNPHNPTGTAHTLAELTEVARLARAYGVRVVVDEIHGPIELPGAAFVPYLTVPGSEDALVLTSASKAWSLAGLKAALMIAGDEAAADLERIPAEASHGASHLGIIAHVAALSQGSDWLDALLSGLDRNRALLGDLVAEQLPGAVYHPPQATYLAWLDCRGLGLDVEPSRAFLERGRVALNAGSSFGEGGAGHVRVNLATSPEILTEAARRMASVLPR